MKISTFLPLTALLSLAAADTLSVNGYPSDVSSCVIQCLSEGAAVAGCVSYVDTECTCSSTAFKNTVKKCLTAACTKDDIAAAGELHKSVCE